MPFLLYSRDHTGVADTSTQAYELHGSSCHEHTLFHLIFVCTGIVSVLYILWDVKGIKLTCLYSESVISLLHMKIPGPTDFIHWKYDLWLVTWLKNCREFLQFLLLFYIAGTNGIWINYINVCKPLRQENKDILGRIRNLFPDLFTKTPNLSSKTAAVRNLIWGQLICCFAEEVLFCQGPGTQHFILTY